MQISIIVTLIKNKIKRVIRVFNKIIVATSSSTIFLFNFVIRNFLRNVI